MSEFTNPSPQAKMDHIKSEIFKKVAGKLLLGTYYPAKDGQPAEFVDDIPELGNYAACSTAAEKINDPEEIHIAWCRPERDRSASIWLTAEGIDVQYSSWDENLEPVTITDRQPIHPEALMELHEALTTNSQS
jgi:hypothetical protein